MRFTGLTDQEKAVLQAVFVSFDQGDVDCDLGYVEWCKQWKRGERENPCGANPFEIYYQMRDELEEAELESMPMSGTSKAGDEPPVGAGFDG